jgi:hypothetical protein
MIEYGLLIRNYICGKVREWLTSWKVWFGEPKTNNIVSLEVGRYKWY